MKQSSQVVLITGCSSGFGLLTAIELAKKYHVIATMRNLDSRKEFDRLCGIHQVSMDLLELDVNDINTISNVVDVIESKYGYLDVLINNAGYLQLGFCCDIAIDELESQFQTNFFGCHRMIRSMIHLLSKSKQAKIINLSSVAGLSSIPFMGAYNGSKFALEGYSESLYYELKPKGIQVCLVEPGLYQTKILENLKIANNTGQNQSLFKESGDFILSILPSFKNRSSKDPLIVVRLLCSIVEKPRLRFRYLIGFTAQLRAVFRWSVPFSVYSYFVQLGFNLLLKKRFSK